MKELSEKLNVITKSLEKILLENKRSKTIEDFQKDCSEMLDMTKECTTLCQKIFYYQQEVNAQLSVTQKKLTDAEHKVLETEQKSKLLKKDLFRTCKCIENFEENEIKLKERIALLESKISNLDLEKDETVPKDEATIEADNERERQLLNSRVQLLEENLRIKESSEQEVKLKLLDAVSAVERLEGNVEDLRSKLKHELERSQKVVKDKVYIEKDARDKDTTIRELEDSVLVCQTKIEELTLDNNILKKKIISCLSKINNMKQIRQKAAKKVGEQIKNVKSITEEKDKLSLLLEKKDEDVKALNAKLVNLINEKEASIQKCLRVESQKQSCDEKIRFLKSESVTVEKEMMKMKRQISQHNAEVANLNREKELLAKNIIKMENLVKKYEVDFKNAENQKIALVKELKVSKQEIDKQKGVISALNSLKSQLLSDVEKLNNKVEALNTELSKQEDIETAVNQEVAELKSKMKEQMHISNAALSDRKRYCQQYKEMKENRDEMKQKTDNLENYINELKEIECNRNKELKVWKEKYEALDLQVRALKSQLDTQKLENEELQRENKHLQELFNSQHIKTSKKGKEIETLQAKINEVTEDNRTLHSKLHKQNKEIETLKEKLIKYERAVEIEKEKFLSFQESTKFFQLEILRLTGEKNAMISRINDLEKLKKSFTYAKEELHKERFKNSALERAMQQPLNVHRWRVLKGTDPERHELLENCQTIQKQLLKKCAETEEKDKKLSNMDKIIQQLKSMTLRQKVLEEKYMQDAKLKVQLQAKNDEIKALKFETNMYMSYTASCKAEIKHLQNELQKMKTQQFLKQKSKSAQAEEETV